MGEKYKKENSEKYFLENLHKNIEAGSFENILQNYEELIELDLNNEKYWNEILDFIYNYYRYSNTLSWEMHLKRGISIAIKAREYMLHEKMKAKYFIDEYNFIIELIRCNNSYSQDYPNDKLIKLLDEAILLDPSNVSAIHLKGNLYQSNEDFVAACKEYDKALSLEKYDTLLYDKAFNHQLMNDLEMSAQIYLNLYEYSKDSFFKKNALENLIRIYTSKEDRENILKYKKILKNTL